MTVVIAVTSCATPATRWHFDNAQNRSILNTEGEYIMRALLVPAMSFALLIAPVLPAMASNDNQGRGHGRGQHVEQQQDQPKPGKVYPLERRAGVAFKAAERQIIAEWFENNKDSSNYSKLPPGLAKQIQKNGTLPPGLAKHGLPPGLEKRLGKAPKGYERIIVGRDVVITDILTGAIIDVLQGVIRN
jgi:hypothetical protein